MAYCPHDGIAAGRHTTFGRRLETGCAGIGQCPSRRHPCGGNGFLDRRVPWNCTRKSQDPPAGIDLGTGRAAALVPAADWKPMTELFSLALEIQDACQNNGWPFCVIGGLAVQHWGEPRFTRDVDLTILTGFGGEEPVVDGCLALYSPRIENARAFALQNRVLLLKSPDGLGIDIALGALDFERSAVERASNIEVIDGKHLRLCTAEDLIVMKAFADRPLDWNDVQGIIVRQGTGNLDWPYIYRHLEPLCEVKEQPEIVDRLRRLADR